MKYSVIYIATILALGPVYTKRQRQRRVNAVMTLAILVSLKKKQNQRNRVVLQPILEWLYCFQRELYC